MGTAKRKSNKWEKTSDTGQKKVQQQQDDSAAVNIVDTVEVNISTTTVDLWGFSFLRGGWE